MKGHEPHRRLVLTIAVTVLVSTIAHSAELVRPLGALPAEAASMTEYYRQNVHDTGGEKIGEIVDILIEKPGHLPATMIPVGSFLALTRKVVAIPFDTLQITFRAHEPHLDSMLTSGRCEALPPSSSAVWHAAGNGWKRRRECPGAASRCHFWAQRPLRE